MFSIYNLTLNNMFLAKDFLVQVKPINPMLKGMAYKLTNSEHASQDLIQDTLHRAIRNLDKFQEGTNLKAWLLTIMKNIFINSYRKNKKKNALIVQTDVISDSHLLNVSSRQIPAEFYMINEVLQKALGSLKEEFRKPFEMHYEGYKYQEICEELNIPLGTVKSRIFFARKELVVFLKKEGITNSSLV